MSSSREREPLLASDHNTDSQPSIPRPQSVANHRSSVPHTTSLESPTHETDGKNGTPETDKSENPSGPPPPSRPAKGRALPALDGGWGWMCVIGSCLMHFLLGGFGRSFGVIYVKMLEKFDCSAATGSTIGGVFTSVRMGCGPLVGVLTKRFSVRSVTAVGALVFAIGSLLCAFASSPIHMFITYSILSGVGGAMVYFPGVVIVGQYFDKRRGRALGLATAGSGLGCIAFPPIYRYLFDVYGFGGTFFIVSGVTLNFLICAALFRPLAHSWRGINVALKRKLRLNPETNQTSKDGIEHQDTIHNSEDTSTIEHRPSGDNIVTSTTDAAQVSTYTDNLTEASNSNSLSPGGTLQPENNENIEGAFKSGSGEITGTSSRSESVCDSVLARGRHDNMSHNNHQIGYGTETPLDVASAEEPEVSVKYFRSGIHRPTSGEQDESRRIVSNGSRYPNPGPSHIPDIEADDSDSQPLLSSPERQRVPEDRASRYSIDSIKRSRAGRLWQTIDNYVGLSLLANPAFSCFVIGSGLGTMAYISAQNLIVAHANDIGIPPSHSVYVLSAIGIADTLGRVVSGVLFDVPVIRRIRSFLYTFIFLGSGLSIIGWAFCTTFIEILALSLANGAFNGAIVTGRAVIVADLVGIENMAQAFGMTVFSQGVFIIVGPYIAGHLKDITGSYVMSYIFSGVSSCVAAALYLVGNRIGPDFRCCRC